MKLKAVMLQLDEKNYQPTIINSETNEVIEGIKSISTQIDFDPVFWNERRADFSLILDMANVEVDFDWAYQREGKFLVRIDK